MCRGVGQLIILLLLHASAISISLPGKHFSNPYDIIFNAIIIKIVIVKIKMGSSAGPPAEEVANLAVPTILEAMQNSNWNHFRYILAKVMKWRP